MADLRRVPVTWTTGAGGTGVSVFYTFSADDVTTELATYFNAVKTAFPTAVTWSIPAAGDEIESSTGALTGAWGGGTAASITGAGGASLYAAGTGFYNRWLTGTIVNGRKLVGRTFMCPVVYTMYATDGTIDTTSLGTMQTAASALAASNKLVIWHRPTGGLSNGVAASVAFAVVPDKVTSLRSRRS